MRSQEYWPRWPKGWILPRPNGSLAFDTPPFPPGCPTMARTLRPYTRTISATSISRTCSWVNCEHSSAAVPRCTGSGWRLILARKFFLYFSSTPARNTWPIDSSTLSDYTRPPFCLPLFTGDGLNLSFYAASSSVWTVAPGGSARVQRAPVAGGTTPDLWSGEEMLSAAQARARLAGDATGNRSRSQSRLRGSRLLWTTQYGF